MTQFYAHRFLISHIARLEAGGVLCHTDGKARFYPIETLTQLHEHITHTAPDYTRPERMYYACGARESIRYRHQYYVMQQLESVS